MRAEILLLVLVLVDGTPARGDNSGDPCPGGWDSDDGETGFLRQACVGVIAQDLCTAYCKAHLDVVANNPDCLAAICNYEGTYDDVNAQHKMELCVCLVSEANLPLPCA